MGDVVDALRLGRMLQRFTLENFADDGGRVSEQLLAGVVDD